MPATSTVPHWSESDRAPVVREVFRNLAPAEWDVHVRCSDGMWFGEMDTADAHGLIARVLDIADRLHQASDVRGVCSS